MHAETLHCDYRSRHDSEVKEDDVFKVLNLFCIFFFSLIFLIPSDWLYDGSMLKRGDNPGRLHKTTWCTSSLPRSKELKAF